MLRLYLHPVRIGCNELIEVLPYPKVGGPIAYPIQDFYLTNPIARSSPTLQRCSAEILHGQPFAEAAE